MLYFICKVAGKKNNIVYVGFLMFIEHMKWLGL